MVFVPIFGVAAPIYKSIDNEGNVSYSDQLRPNSEQIIINIPNIPQAASATSQEPSTLLNPEAKAQDTKQIKQYSISITEPTNESVFSTDIEKIQVNLSIEPNLSENDYVALKINDRIYNNAPGVTSFTLGRLDRGSYKLQAFVYSTDRKNKPKGQSNIITIHQIRATIIPALQ